MAYTDIDKPSDYFETVTYTGNGGTQSITSLDFAPSLCWIKNRTQAYNNSLFDIIRGVGVRLQSDDTPGDNAMSDGLTAFNSDGFSVGANSQVNKASQNIVSWNWKAGTSFTNDASATGIGSIDSTGSVNTDAGFSIVSYTGNGSNGASFSHGLNVKPKIVLIKNRTTAKNWVYWQDTTNNGTSDVRLCLNLTNANFNNFHVTFGTSTITLGDTDDAWNKSGDNLIAYCFAEKQGYSKFGSYTGNGNADGTFVYTGFKPAWVMVKPTEAADNWVMFDNKRLGFNSSTSPYNFYANKNFTETTDTGELDFTAQGFKIRNSGNTVNRTSTFIYMAFAENPFVTGSSGIPTTAR